MEEVDNGIRGWQHRKILTELEDGTIEVVNMDSSKDGSRKGSAKRKEQTSATENTTGPEQKAVKIPNVTAGKRSSDKEAEDQNREQTEHPGSRGPTPPPGLQETTDESDPPFALD